MLAALLVCGLRAPAMAQQTIGELYATDASVKGSVILAGSGTSVLSGSSIEAGAQAATLKLERGGSLLVCQGTRLSVTASQSGRELLLSLNSGNLELNYPLGAEADTLLTPDLRLLLPGPGTVHIAVRVTPRGDTCVQSLPANMSAIVVSETMGDATYQVKPDEAVLFQAGHLAQASRSRDSCGCPTAPPTREAKAEPPAVPAPVQPKPAEPVAAVALPPAQPQPAKPLPAAPPPPAEQHLTVEAPFVFRGNDPVPDLTENVAILRLENTRVIQLEPVVLPPSQKTVAANRPQVAKKQPHGLFGRVGAFFAAIFH
ncbi:MAG TPA: hypothetical protein VL240_09105 [Candidatus Binatia bacterium]|nr:hypothetical protein [Candidatus Binatia bacterium]